MTSLVIGPSSRALTAGGRAGAQAWRLPLLNALLTVAAALATVGFAAIGAQVITRRQPVGLAILATFYVGLVMAAALRRLPYGLRSAILLICLGGVGILGFVHVGFQLGPGLGSALTVVLAGLLLGRRLQLALFGLTLVAIVAIGVLQARTNARFIVPTINDPTLLPNWIRVAAVYALFTGVLVSAVNFVRSRMEQTLAERTDALEQLQAAITRQQAAERARDEAQQTILQMQKMEAVGRLAGGVAHDFNNALVVILSWADMLRDKVPAQDATSWQAGLSEISAAGHRAASLTQQLLSFARKSVLSPQALSVARSIAEVTRMFGRLLPANIHLVTRVPEDLPAVHADATQLHQAMLNLCMNARDAMPDGGTLEISATITDGANHPHVAAGQWIALAVRDTGIGMDEATQARAFEPFFSTKGDLGTGLGLASVYGIVKQLNGHVHLQSQPGQGSTFTLLLPATSASEAPLSIPAEITPLPRAGTILIAEDNEAIRRLMVAALERAGYGVMAADTGNTAIELARRCRTRIDLLCTDGMMPGMSSVALVEDFLALFPKGRVLVCSGHIEKSLQDQLAKADVRYLHKPFTGTTLVNTVADLLGHTRNLAAPPPA